MEGTIVSTVLSLLFFCLFKIAQSETIPLPAFSELKKHYPGFYNFGGLYRRHDVIDRLGIRQSAAILLHDSSALRLSYTLNRIGDQHSLGTGTIHLSKYGTDSVSGKQNLQYIFHPLAFGPYLADKYGYPTVTKMHLFDPVKTKQSFQGKQGIMRVITYAQHDNQPKGHVALWDCTGFYKAKDFFKGHTLLSVEFWESPDTDCSSKDDTMTESDLFKSDEPKPKDSILQTILQQRIRRPSHRKHG